MPEEVRNLLVDLRTYLQERLEPPVYVSDRRLLKAVNLMKVCPPFISLQCLIVNF